MTEVTEQLRASLAGFSSERRLYALTVDGANPDDLMVEAFFADDPLQGVDERDIIALSPSAHLNLADLLGSEGGPARYRLRLTPWLSRRPVCRLAAARRPWSRAMIIPASISTPMPRRRSATPAFRCRRTRRTAACGRPARPCVRCAPAPASR